jgi:hypothetical protein
VWQYARLRDQLCDAWLMELFDQTHIAVAAVVITMTQAAEEPQDQAAQVWPFGIIKGKLGPEVRR